MGTVYTSALTTNAITTTGHDKRDVSDTIRHLLVGMNLWPLIAPGMIPSLEGVIKSKNLISKRKVQRPKYETFYWLPNSVLYTASAGGTATGEGDDITVTVASTAGLRPKYSVVHTTQGSFGRISSIESSTQFKVTSIGSTDMVVASGDELLVCGALYDENSSSPYILMKDPDNDYNYTAIGRYAVACSGSSEGNPAYGGLRYKMVKEEMVYDGMRKEAYKMLFSIKPADAEYVTDAVLSDTARSYDGVRVKAQKTYNFNGGLTLEKLVTEMPLSMHESVQTTDPLIWLVGTKTYARVLSGILDKTMYTDSKLEKVGAKAKTIITAKGDIDLVMCDAFDQGKLQSEGLIMNPERWQYVVLRDRDYKPQNNIEGNDVDGRIDEILGENSIAPDDNGYSTMRTINHF